MSIHDTQGLLQRFQEEHFRIASKALGPMVKMQGGPGALAAIPGARAMRIEPVRALKHE